MLHVNHKVGIRLWVIPTMGNLPTMSYADELCQRNFTAIPSHEKNVQERTIFVLMALLPTTDLLQCLVSHFSKGFVTSSK
jgi:hypothetical protein